MTNETLRASADWLGGVRTYLLAWGLPHGAIIAGLLLDVPLRAVVWIAALVWMGVACILNARRCGRTHCRFTGPYYLAMILPVTAFGSGTVSLSIWAWVALGVLIIAGGKVIWWVTERAWGKFS